MKVIKKLILVAFLIKCSFFSFAQTNQLAVANQFYNNGEFDKAVKYYENEFKNGKNLSVYDQYLSCLIQLKRFDEAEKTVKRVIKAEPQNINFQIDLGKVYQESSQTEKMNNLYQQLIQKLSPDQFKISELANSFYRVEQYDFAIKTFVYGRELLKNDRIFNFELIGLYRFKRQKDEVIYEYLTLLEQNPEFLQQAKNTFVNLLTEENDFDKLKSLLIKKIQKNPQVDIYTDLLAWAYIQQKEYSLALTQLVAVDKRNKENGSKIFELARLFADNNAYEDALKALDYVILKGLENEFYIAAKVENLRIKNIMLTSQKFSVQELTKIKSDYLALFTEFGRNNQTLFAVKELANLEAYYLKDYASAEKTLEQAIDLPAIDKNNLAEIKLDLGDIYLLRGEIWDAALLYGQVEKSFTNEPLGQEAKFRNAKLSFFSGDFSWAKSQLDVLKASTSQLIANDALNLSLLIQDNLAIDTAGNALKVYAKADLLIFKKQYDNALKLLDSIKILYPQNDLDDDILMSKSKVYEMQNLTDQSITSLKEVLNNYKTGIWADDATYLLAENYRLKKNDPKEAQQYYELLIKEFPGSLFITDARKQYRLLRGDVL